MYIAAPGKGEDLDGQAGDFYPGLKGTSFTGMTPAALIWAYLRSALFAGDTSWAVATAALEAQAAPMAQIATK